jgi:predicted SAM-dependent methyltransferase
MKLLNLGCGHHYHSAWINVDFASKRHGVIAHNLKKGLPFPDESFDVVYHSHLLEHFSKDYAPIFLRECFRVLKPKGIIRVVVPDFERIARIYLELLEQALEGDKVTQSRYEWIVLEMFDQMVRNKPGGAMLDYWKRNPMPAEDFVIERVGSEVINALAVLRSPTAISQAANRAEKDARTDEHALRIGTFRLSGEVHQWMYDRYSLSVLLKEAGFPNIHQCRADESSIPDFDRYGLDLEPDGSVRKPDSLFMEATKPASGYSVKGG